MQNQKTNLARVLIPLFGVLCLSPIISSGIALILGIGLALLLENPYFSFTKTVTPKLLSYSIVGLGAGMNLMIVARVGIQGISYTVIGIAITFLLGTIAGRILKIERTTSLLITTGTAICGGSAIAAVGAAIRAKHSEMSVSLGTVFLLNALALLIFPPLGHYFLLDERQFGLWSALAIHDTSSVVGASSTYGVNALKIATTVKLARALWIIPLTFIFGALYKNSEEKNQTTVKPKKPWFILGFVTVAAIVTWIPGLETWGTYVEYAARRLLVLTLFLIGSNISRETIRSVGFRPLVQGVLLWFLVAAGTLVGVLNHWIK